MIHRQDECATTLLFVKQLKILLSVSTQHPCTIVHVLVDVNRKPEIEIWLFTYFVLNNLKNLLFQFNKFMVGKKKFHLTKKLAQTLTFLQLAIPDNIIRNVGKFRVKEPDFEKLKVCEKWWTGLLASSGIIFNGQTFKMKINKYTNYGSFKVLFGQPHFHYVEFNQFHLTST